jgi:uncharacterized protein YggU (UPF0235/DUF167 family)
MLAFVILAVRMYIRVRVQAGAKNEAITLKKEGWYAVAVREPAERNLANTRVRELLAAELSVPVSAVRLIGGHTSPSKVFSIMGK